MRRRIIFSLLILFSLLGLPFRSCGLELPVDRVICSGPGALRLLTYLQAQGMIVGVEDIEKRHSRVDPRPYFLTHPEFREFPLIGEFRGFTRPELVLSLDPQPQVIFKTYPNNGITATELADSTGIPVIPLSYGNLGNQRDALFRSLRTMGETLGREERAEEVITFINNLVTDLARRTAGIPLAKRPTCFVGGVAYRGPHGLTSTEKGYPPFRFIAARDALFGETEVGERGTHADVSRENLLQADPDFLFIDLSTINADGKAGALYQLRNDPLWQELKAVREGHVYGVLPYNWYSQNFGSILANAYFVGKTLFPQAFSDIDPQGKADEIFGFLVGKPVFAEMQRSFQGMAFRPIPLGEE